MKDHRARSMGDTASAVGSMLLFVLFAVCMLMAVAVAADTYSRIKTGYQQSFGTAASIKYISNKLRAAENVTLLEDGSAAAIESAGTVSVIYCGDGGLYEKNTVPGGELTADGGELTADGGELISAASSLEFSEHDGLYEITVGSGSSSSVILVRKG
jgi:hypothetical protein